MKFAALFFLVMPDRKALLWTPGLLPKAGMIWRGKTWWRWHEPNKNRWVMFEATSIIWPKQNRKRSTSGSIIGIICVKQRKRVCKLSTFLVNHAILGDYPIYKPTQASTRSFWVTVVSPTRKLTYFQALWKGRLPRGVIMALFWRFLKLA